MILYCKTTTRMCVKFRTQFIYERAFNTVHWFINNFCAEIICWLKLILNGFRGHKNRLGHPLHLSNNYHFHFKRDFILPALKIGRRFGSNRRPSDGAKLKRWGGIRRNGAGAEESVSLKKQWWCRARPTLVAAPRLDENVTQYNNCTGAHVRRWWTMKSGTYYPPHQHVVRYVLGREIAGGLHRTPFPLPAGRQ